MVFLKMLLSILVCFGIVNQEETIMPVDTRVNDVIEFIKNEDLSKSLAEADEELLMEFVDSFYEFKEVLKETLGKEAFEELFGEIESIE